MGAVFAASARAPITAVIIVFELTGEYSVILPLMIAVIAATSVSALLSPDTIYTLKLRRRGIRVDHPRVPSVLRTTTVQAALLESPPTVGREATVAAVVAVLEGRDGGSVPVLDEDGRLLGVIGLADLEDSMQADDDSASAADLARTPAQLRITDSLEDAVHVLARSPDEGLPVLDHEGETVAGWVTHRSVLHAYHLARQALAGRDGAADGGAVVV